MRKLFLKDPSKPLFWLLCGVVVKMLPLVSLLYHGPPPSSIPGIWAGTILHDSRSYLDPIDNLLAQGKYLPDFRMPGYGAIYLLLRLFFAQDYACNILIILQFILAGISAYYLALIARYIFQSNGLFYLCFYLYLISTYSNFYDGWIMTESFCNSALIFSVWFFVKYFQTGILKNLFYSGVFLTWTIFLKPVYVSLIFVFLFILIFQRKRVLLSLTLFIVSFVLLDGAWILYNISAHHKIIPLTRSALLPHEDTSYEKPLFEFINAWGGSADFSDNHSQLRWFGYHYQDTPHPAYYKPVPGTIYTSAFNKDSILEIKRMVTAVNDSNVSPESNYVYQKVLKEKLARYTFSVQHEKPFLYYIYAPLFGCLPLFLFGPQSNFYLKRFLLPGNMAFLTEDFFTLFYYSILILGITGAILMLYKEFRRNKLTIIVALIPLFVIIIHSIILRMNHNRYLFPAWAFLILCAAYTIRLLFKYIKGKYA